MDELDETEVPTVGERLRAAREGKGLSLEDVAAQTRIPRRHLESLEQADWENLPAPTYTTGFAKSYASAVGLDRTEIGEQLRIELGGVRAPATQAEVFEPADPARTMPRWLVLAAIAAVVLVIVVMTWLSNRSLHDEGSAGQPAATAPATTGIASQPAARTQAPAPQPAASGPVVITATAPAWLRVTDQGKTLHEATLQPGQSYEVPATAVAPLLRIGAPEAVRITVGTTVVPQVGPSGRVKSNVSLKGVDLVKSGQATAGAGTPTAGTAGQ